MTKSKFQDTRESIYSFISEFLVVCPRCQGLASINKIDAQNSDYLAPRRLVCGKCGLTKDWAEKSLLLGNRCDPPVDSCFGLPLFLAAPCGGHTLWAYNLKHLNLIEEYVNADLRQHIKHEIYGWNNGSLVNRLPQWMIAAKNRDNVLKTVARLKDCLQKAT